MEKTAIEWLENQLRKKHTLTMDDIKDIEEAKVMEKEQIIEAWEDGCYQSSDFPNTNESEQYYKETFKSE